MIARTWRGAVRPVDADSYLAYLHQTGLAGYASTPGNQGIVALRRPVSVPAGPAAEFLLLTPWDSMRAVERFAGREPSRAVFYPEDERFLVDRDLTVNHYDVVFQHPPSAEPARPASGVDVLLRRFEAPDGHATAAFDDGRVFDLRAGNLFYIPPEPHDSWVVGEEPYVSLHFLGAGSYAAR